MPSPSSVVRDPVEEITFAYRQAGTGERTDRQDVQTVGRTVRDQSVVVSMHLVSSRISHRCDLPGTHTSYSEWFEGRRMCASLELMTSAAASTRSRCEVVSCCSTRYIVCILNIAYKLPRQRATLQSVGSQNWILCAGGLHIVFALLRALGKTVDGSGLDVCSIETGIYTSASLRRIFGGKAYKRGIEFHITMFLAVLMMKLDAIAGITNDGIIAKCAALREALRDRSANVMEIYEEVSTWQSQHLLSSDPHSSEMAKFLDQYMEQINSLLHLIHACRSADWEGFIAALDNNMRFFFARDLLNYAWMMPVYLRQMTTLEQDDPASWQALKEGAFVVAKSGVPFTPVLLIRHWNKRSRC